MNINEKGIRCLAVGNGRQVGAIMRSTENIIDSYRKKTAKNNYDSNNLPTETLLAMQEIEEGKAVKESKIIDLELP